jgi:hypothetical protein
MATRQEALDCFNNLLTNFNLKDSGIRLEYIKGGMYRLWNVDVCVTTFYDAREVIAGVTMLRAMLPAMECKNKTKNAKDLVMNQYPNAYTKQRGDGLWYVHIGESSYLNHQGARFEYWAWYNAVMALEG